MKFNSRFWAPVIYIGGLIMAGVFSASGQTNDNDYQIFVSNEKSGDLTVISGGDFKVVATIPAGKRPRGIHASPDGRMVYVALSGTPIEPPPQLDANGNPILKKIRMTTMIRSKPTRPPTASVLWMPCRRNFCARFPPVPTRSNSA